MSAAATDASKIKLRLHYWNCRGRGQALRYMLEDIARAHEDVEYEETFEPIDSIMSGWGAHKEDQSISGPFRTLPVLHWNDTDTFGQTLTLAHVLARKFNLYGQVTSSMKDPVVLEGYLNGVVACAYTDVIVPALQCIWSTPSFENQDTFEFYPIRLAKDSLHSLNTLLKKSSTPFFYDQENPTVADYFAFDAYNVARELHPIFLPDDHEALDKLVQIMKERPALADYFESGRMVKPYTAAPHEAEYLDQLSKTK